MQKEQITDKEAISLIIVFIFGSTLIIGTGGEAKNDAWIAVITGFIMAIPVILVYSRIISLYPGRDLFEILQITLGKIIGKIITAIYIWYAFHLGALIIRNFGEFTESVALTDTPKIVTMIGLGLVCIVAVRMGIEVMVRTCAFFLPVLLSILLLVQLLSIPQLKFDYLKPIFGEGIAPVLKGGFQAFSFPFAETILFIGVFYTLKTKKSAYRVYFWGLFISGMIIMLVAARNTAVLGVLKNDVYFPSYMAVGRIKIGDFLQRMEGTVSIVFVFGAFIKTSVCLFCACKGISSLFNIKHYSSIVIQTGLLICYFSYILYDNIMQMDFWAIKIYPYYALPFQVIIPAAIWIAAEIRKAHSVKE